MNEHVYTVEQLGTHDIYRVCYYERRAQWLCRLGFSAWTKRKRASRLDFYGDHCGGRVTREYPEFDTYGAANVWRLQLELTNAQLRARADNDWKDVNQ